MPNKQYISYQIQEADADKQDLLVAMLQDYGFDGFEQTATALIANGYHETLDTEAIETYLKSTNIRYTQSVLEAENWNKMWESDFHPIIIDQFCAVRAGFHEPVANVLHDIIITPKMSFGTGHHATTRMMLKAMETMNFTGTSVIDFGTGTGVLAILAEKMGAASIEAIDYDDWCIENGKENTAANHCSRIHIVKADNLSQAQAADIILANINKNIIMSNFGSFKQLLAANGNLLVSGILVADEMDINEAAQYTGLKMVSITETNGWLCMLFQHAA